MKRILIFLSLFISAFVHGQNLGAPIFASQNKANNQIPIYTKSYWKDITTDWTVTGMTTSKNADSSFRIPTGANDFSQFMTLKSATNNDENFDFEIIFKVTAISGSTTGTPIGRKSSNSTFSRSLAVDLDFSQALGTGTFLKVCNGIDYTVSNLIYSGFIGPLPTAGDLLSLTYSQRGNVINISYRDLTSGFFAASPPLVSALTSQTWLTPNTGDFCIWNNSAGPTDIQSIKISSYSNPNPKIMWIGDSKVSGIGALYQNNRAINLCRGLGSQAVMAGVGDKTADILADTAYIFAHFLPKYLILNIGSNDVRAGVASATYEANYSAIVSAFQKHGVIVILMLPIQEAVSFNQTTLSSYISSTYSGLTIIDPNVLWSNPLDLSADSTHPTPAGYRLYANQVLRSTGIANNNDQFDYPLFTNNAIDILPPASPWIKTASGLDIYYTAGNAGVGRAPTVGLDNYSLTATRITKVESGLNTGFAYFNAANNLGNGLLAGVVGTTSGGFRSAVANSVFLEASDGSGPLVIMQNGITANGTVQPIIFNLNNAEVARYDVTGHYVPGVNLTSNIGSASLRWANLFVQNDLATGAESHGFVTVSGTGTYNALATDRTIEFTGTTATLAYPTLNLVNGRHLNIVNYGSGALTIPSTKSGNGATITTLASNARAQVEYDLGNTTWVQVGQ